MSNATPGTAQQRFAQDFDEERFREQLNWLIDNLRVLKKGHWVKRTLRMIVDQIHAQHPGFQFTYPHFLNLTTGRKKVIVTLQLALYLCQVFGIELDFFLDTDMERQRALISARGNLQQQVQEPSPGVTIAGDRQASIALRGTPITDQLTLDQLRQLQSQTEEGELLSFLRGLSESQRRLLETMTADPTFDGGLEILAHLRAVPEPQRRAIEHLIRESVATNPPGKGTKAKTPKRQT
ncbi:MAG: hypothetical protein H0X24_00370 [Ktedonobacterales bacterium]|nr:hypothetical protein [Ktedonobacterales bacterium]